MSAPVSEFPRPIRLDTLGEAERDVPIEATEAERAALAKRFGLLGLDRLAADVRFSRNGQTVLAVGRIAAAVTQACVATSQPVPAVIDEPFRLRFVPDEAAVDPEEIELSEEDCDTVPYTDGVIDIGEAVAETLALALEPFPRSPDAAAILKAAGVVQEDAVETGPFAALKALRDKLGE